MLIRLVNVRVQIINDYLFCFGEQIINDYFDKENIPMFRVVVFNFWLVLFLRYVIKILLYNTPFGCLKKYYMYHFLYKI